MPLYYSLKLVLKFRPVKLGRPFSSLLLLIIGTNHDRNQPIDRIELGKLRISGTKNTLVSSHTIEKDSL